MFSAAVSKGHKDVVDVLLKHHASIDARGGKDNKPVIVIAGSTFVQEDIAFLLEEGADVNSTCDQGTTALMSCAYSGDEDALRYLISKKADHTISSSKWGTALHVAAAEGYRSCCEILLEAGADPNAVGGPWGTPLAAAAERSDLEIVQCLLAAGAHAAGAQTISGKYGSPLQAACASGHVEVVEELLQHGAIIDLQPSNGKYGYPLHAACQTDNFEAVDLLLKQGANVHLEGGIHGFAIIAAASTVDTIGIIGSLLNHGADLSVQPDAGLFGSVVAAASFAGDANVLQFLLDKGANIHQTG